MSDKKPDVDATATNKRLVLRREKVRDLNVRTGVKTVRNRPGSAMSYAPPASNAGSLGPLSKIKPPPPQA